MDQTVYRDTRQAHEALHGFQKGGDAILDRLSNLHTAAARVPLVLSVQRFERVDNSPLHARVLFEAAGTVNAYNLEAAVTHDWGNVIRMLPGSGHFPLADSRADDRLVAAFVVLNTPQRRYEAAAVDGMRVLASGNVFADASDKIWRKQGDMLVQDSQDNLEAVLSQRQSDSVVTASVHAQLGETYATGDGVLWYDPRLEKQRVGVAVAGTPDGRYPGLVMAFDARGSAQEQSSKLEIVAVDPRCVLVCSAGDHVTQAAVTVREQADIPIPGQDPNAQNLPAQNLPTSSLPPSSYPTPPGFNAQMQGIVPNGGIGSPGISVLDRKPIQDLIANREPLTRDNLIERHLAYMNVLYSQRGEYFQRLQTMLQGAFRQSMALT